MRVQRTFFDIILACALGTISVAYAADSSDQLERKLKEHEDFVQTLVKLGPKVEAGLSTFMKQPELLKMQCRMWQGQMRHSIGQAKQDEASLEAQRVNMATPQSDRLDTAKRLLDTVSSEFLSCREL